MNIQTRHIIAALVAGLAFSANATTTGTSTTPSITTNPLATNTLPPPDTAPTTVSTTSPTPPVPVSNGTQGIRLVSQYAGLAGSTANAQSLVTGLRTGAPITLQGTTILPTDPASPPSTTNSVTFTAPTQPMGWGNVSKALSLAQADLASAGITNPTPQQLQTALTGGNITVTQGGTTQTTKMDGILTMRSQGMGWGQIAHQLNLHPGSAFKSGQTQGLSDHHAHALQGNHHSEMEVNEHHHITSANGSPAGTTHRVMTASGKSTHTGSASSEHDGSYQSTHAERPISSHIVTAGGASLAGGGSYHHVEHGNDAGIQTVSHVTTAASGGTLAAGNISHGNAAGHGKL